MNNRKGWRAIASEQLRRDEGDKQFPYRDSKNILSIAIGHNLEAKGLPKPIRDALLEYDINEVWLGIQSSEICSLFNSLSELRKAVLINIGFNVGIKGLLQFRKMIAAIRENNYSLAADEIRNSQLADLRKERLAKDMKNG